MHHSYGNWVVIGRAVMYYAWASHTFTAEMKCPHCMYTYTTLLNHIMIIRFLVSGIEGFSGPDGIDFDEEGYLLVTNWGTSYIDVFAPHGGDPVLRIKCPFASPSNLEFRPNSKEVFVTDQSVNNALWRFKWRVKGRRKWAYL